MSKRNEIYKKFYDSDIFNTNPNYTRVEVEAVKPKNRINHPTLENTKEEVFNIGKERRIKRNKGNREKEDFQNNTVGSRSVAKRKNNYDKIYGSDIFNQRLSTSTERRRGVKQIPNVTNKTTLLNQIGNNEEYVKDLKYYTSQHRTEKKEYDPDIYMSKITPQERYYNELYSNHEENQPKKNGKNDDKKLNDYIHNKLNLKKEMNKYNNVGADKKGNPDNVNYKEKRYFKQKPILYEGRRNFVDSNQYPQNNCKINKQIQMESHIFSNEDKKKDFNEEVKEINDRLEKEKRKVYNTNVLGQPYININKKKDSINTDRSLYGSVNSKWGRSNIDWRSPEAQVMFANSFSDENKCQTARERKINHLSGSQNVDILSGREKEPVDYKYEKEEKINNSGKKKLNEIIEELPNLNEGQKLGIKMKASALDCSNDNEWDNKGKLLNDYYINKNNYNKEKEVTGKVNDKNDRINNELRNYNKNDNIYHDYVITYSTKGNEFEKFDEADIQKLFGTKGIQTYDIHKNPFDKGNYNMINLKIKGNDNNNELYNKVKKVQDELRKENYKINIEKGRPKNYGKKYGKMVTKPGSKVGFLNDNANEGSKYKVMPNEMKARKGFTKEFAQINMGYKKPVI